MFSVKTDTRKFTEAIHRHVKIVNEEVQKAIADSADEFVGVARQLAPHETGALRESIVWQWDSQRRVRYSQSLGLQSKVRGLGLAAVVSVGNTKVRYAHLVEFGTGPHENAGKFKGTMHPGTTGRPFFFPAYRICRQRIGRRVGRAVSRAIKKAGF